MPGLLPLPPSSSQQQRLQFLLRPSVRHSLSLHLSLTTAGEGLYFKGSREGIGLTWTPGQSPISRCLAFLTPAKSPLPREGHIQRVAALGGERILGPSFC